ncbi:MAG: carboxypeptidase regulatory-like domain-containing protein [Acidobacteriaceae bacterium]
MRSSHSSCRLRAWLLLACLTGAVQAQTQSAPTAGSTPPSTSVPDAPDTAAPSKQDKAEEQLKQQERQRIAGIVPNFNVSYQQDALALSRTQKLRLAWHTATDPVTFAIAGFDAGLSQAQNEFPGYGQGAQGYAKRFGASYADNFDGTMLGNALLPILFKQDPRYFRRGEGSFSSRLLYSLSTTVWCRNDSGSHGPNFSNILGNLAAGGISNLYYPSTDRGAGLTFERGLTVTAYGSAGGVFNEFWPDIARKILKNKMAKLQPHVPPPSVTPSAPAPH